MSLNLRTSLQDKVWELVTSIGKNIHKVHNLLKNNKLNILLNTNKVLKIGLWEYFKAILLFQSISKKYLCSNVPQKIQRVTSLGKISLPIPAAVSSPELDDSSWIKGLCQLWSWSKLQRREIDRFDFTHLWSCACSIGETRSMSGWRPCNF